VVLIKNKLHIYISVLNIFRKR